jgi:diaminopimelate decarboxylase
VRDLARELTARRLFVDEDDFRARCRSFRAAFGGAPPTSTTPARRSSARGRALGRRGGPVARRVHRRRARGRRCAPASPPSGSPCTATTSRSPSSARARRRGRPDRRRLVRRDRPAGCGERRLGGVRQRVLVRVTSASRRTPTSSSRPPTRTRSSASRSPRRGAGAVMAARCSGSPSLELVGLHSHIGSQIFDTAGFEVAAHRSSACAQIRDEHGIELPELDLGGGSASPTPATTRSTRRDGGRCATIVERECARTGWRCRASRSSRAGRSSARHDHAVRGGHRQGRRPRRGLPAPTSASTAG